MFSPERETSDELPLNPCLVFYVGQVFTKSDGQEPTRFYLGLQFHDWQCLLYFTFVIAYIWRETVQHLIVINFLCSLCFINNLSAICICKWFDYVCRTDYPSVVCYVPNNRQCDPTCNIQSEITSTLHPTACTKSALYYILTTQNFLYIIS